MARQTKLEIGQIQAQILKAEQQAIKRGFITKVNELEFGWHLAVWYNGKQKASIELAKAGNCVCRFYDAKGTTVRVTTDQPVSAVGQCYAG